MTPRFSFKLSYRNEVVYHVNGSEESKEVEMYFPIPAFSADYDRKTWNGNDAEYQADAIARIGGVTNRTGTYRISYQLWQAFVNFLVQKRRDEEREIKANPERYGNISVEPVSIPKPIYWDHTEHTWCVEPWFIGGS